MNKKINIIIIGFGSIGRRHYANLAEMGYKNVFVYDINKEGIGKNIKAIEKLNEKNLKKFQVAFICNPTNLHIKTALACANAGCHLFIEKPLAHNLKNIETLIKSCKEKKLINLVACNMRFNPCLKYIEQYLSKGKLGKVYSINHEFGYYLPYWRPGQDYRKNYAAKKSTGGGIILDDIHEFDLLFWLNDYKGVIDSKLICGKLSDLKIETEDICLAVFKFKNKVFGSVRSDYLQQAYSRGCKITGAKGNLLWNFKENIVHLETKEKAIKLFGSKQHPVKQMYVDELKYFFSCVEKNKPTFNDAAKAYELLKYCLPQK